MASSAASKSSLYIAAGLPLLGSGRLLLETQAGKDVYEVLKAVGGRCQ